MSIEIQHSRFTDPAFRHHVVERPPFHIAAPGCAQHDVTRTERLACLAEDGEYLAVSGLEGIGVFGLVDQHCVTHSDFIFSLEQGFRRRNDAVGTVVCPQTPAAMIRKGAHVGYAIAFPVCLFDRTHDRRTTFESFASQAIKRERG